jgi:HemX protein
VIHLTALTLYIVAFALWLRSLLTGGGGRKGAALASGAASAAVAIHAVALVTFVVRFRELPLSGLGPALSTMAFTLGLALLGVAFRGEVARVGIVLVPVIVLLQSVALTVGLAPVPGGSGIRGAWFAAHVLLALVGFQGLTMSSAAGLLYLIQFQELKNKRLGRLFRFLPPLATLDRLSHVALVVGLATMTLALGIGWAWADRYQGGVNWQDPKIAWALLSWAALAVPLLARAGGGARAWRSSVLSVGGFVVVVAVYLLIRLAPAAGPGFL